jgi:hypothetical protein
VGSIFSTGLGGRLLVRGIGGLLGLPFREGGELGNLGCGEGECEERVAYP